MCNRLTRRTIAAATLALALATSPAVADTTGTMGASATIVTTCTIGTPPAINMGNRTTTQGITLSSGANIPVTCSNGGAYKVFIDNGQNFAAGTRNMANGSNRLAYSLFTDAAKNTPFPTSAADAASQTGTGTLVNTMVVWQLNNQPTPPVGTYTDTLLITVQY